MARLLTYLGIGASISLLLGLAFGTGVSAAEPYADVPDVIVTWLGFSLIAAAMSTVIVGPLMALLFVAGLLRREDIVGRSNRRLGALCGLSLSLPFAGLASLMLALIDFRNPWNEILSGTPRWLDWFVLDIAAALGMIGCVGAWGSGFVVTDLLAARSQGRCGRCGYDLSGTPERCPECGAAASEVTVDSSHGEEDQEDDPESAGKEGSWKEGRQVGRQEGGEDDEQHEEGGQEDSPEDSQEDHEEDGFARLRREERRHG